MTSSEGVNSPTVAALRFCPVQLTRARELRGLTKTALAERIDKSPSAITQFESPTSSVKPDAQTLAQVALALGLPVGFFARRPYVGRASLDSCHFRSLRSVGQARRRQALRIGELVQEVVCVLEEQGVEFPQDNLSPLRQSVRSADEIERLAASVRAHWGLGMGPLHAPVRLLEANGVRVLPLTDACDGVDAFSTWIGETPLVMLDLFRPASRIHFDAAHELGHLLMHEDVVPASVQAESEANRFAAAFLLPRETFLPECPGRWNLNVFLALKERWRVSVQALLVRGHKLGRISTSTYRRAFQILNRLGLRTRETGEWSFDRPQALKKAIALVEHDMPLSRIAERLTIHQAHLHGLLEPIL